MRGSLFTKGVFCVICDYKATPIEVDRTKAAEQSWVTRRPRYGESGMKKDPELEGELFGQA